MAHNIERARTISKSMISYLKRAKEYKEFLLRETNEFERGKRHLANMMGLKSEEMTQQDIDEAISYLFPSGLLQKRAKPIMQHPDHLHRAQKDAQFDVEGRPHHHLFYTNSPNYFEALSGIRKLMTKMNEIEDTQLANGVVIPPEDSKFDLMGRRWLTKDELVDKFIEKLLDVDYEYFIRCLQKLIEHKYSSQAKDLVLQYSVELPEQSSSIELPKILKDESTGEIYTEMVERRREHRVWVKTVLNGTGKIDIHGQDILFFRHPYVRTGLLAPLSLTGMQDKVDIIAKLVLSPMGRDPITTGQGQISMAAAIKLAVSRSIAAYVGPELTERLRLAGLLERDLRLSERKKFGQMKARRKYTWKKR